MRLEAQEKLGFYPAAPEAIAGLAKHLVCSGAGIGNAATGNDGNGEIYALDPCAGEGAAIRQLSEELGIPQTGVYAIELDDGRGAAVRAAMPHAHVLSPCSFDGAVVGWGSFGLVYCNPPYDYLLGGGGREELNFARISANLLCRGGVFVLVLPYAQLLTRDTKSFLDSHFEDCGAFCFPAACRSYNEVVFIGRKRRINLTLEGAYKKGWLHNQLHIESWGSLGPKCAAQLQELGEPQRRWVDGILEPEVDEYLFQSWIIPRCFKPHSFAKGAYLPDELLAAISRSKLNRLVEGEYEPPTKQPPIPLGGGHVATLLAAGNLDGIVLSPRGNHVLRGVSYRELFENEEAGSYCVSEDGKTAKIKEVISEYPATKVRAIDATGTIYTFTFAPNQPKKEPVAKSRAAEMYDEVYNSVYGPKEQAG